MTYQMVILKAKISSNLFIISILNSAFIFHTLFPENSKYLQLRIFIRKMYFQSLHVPNQNLLKPKGLSNEYLDAQHTLWSRISMSYVLLLTQIPTNGKSPKRRAINIHKKYNTIKNEIPTFVSQTQTPVSLKHLQHKKVDSTVPSLGTG